MGLVGVPGRAKKRNQVMSVRGAIGGATLCWYAWMCLYACPLDYLDSTELWSLGSAVRCAAVQSSVLWSLTRPFVPVVLDLGRGASSFDQRQLSTTTRYLRTNHAAVQYILYRTVRTVARGETSRRLNVSHIAIRLPALVRWALAETASPEIVPHPRYAPMST